MLKSQQQKTNGEKKMENKKIKMTWKEELLEIEAHAIWIHDNFG